jgi:NADH-quinone oxidoreductase subunit C
LADIVRTGEEQTLAELGEYVRAKVPSGVTDVGVVFGELIVTVARESIPRVLMALREDSNCLFTVLVDICGVDYPDRAERFDVVYNLLSLRLNQRIRVKTVTDEDSPVPSATGVYAAAGWYEREAWDLYGIMFSGHPDLRRILTDYGFDGHPMRKDFPLTGFVEVRYDVEQKRVVYEPVKLLQEFRRFDFMSPWEGAEYILPGDEKAAAPKGQG